MIGDAYSGHRSFSCLRWPVLVVVLALVLGPEAVGATWSGDNGRLVVGTGNHIYLWELGSTQTTDLGVGELPKWSPSGTEIAFGWGSSDREPDGTPYGLDVSLVSVDGSNRHRLTHTGWNSGPSWSPDGSMIAFHSIREPFADIWVDGDYNIWVMGADGSDQHQLTSAPGWETFPAWAPDGSKIAYEVGNFFFSIWVMNADGSNARELTTEPGFAARNASWSPDGTRIAYTRYEEEVEGIPGDVYVVDLETVFPERLTDNPAFDGFPVWSPDGDEIIFWSERNGVGGLWKMNADGSDQVRLDAPAHLQYAHYFDWERVKTTVFDDVPAENVFYGDIEWLAGEGITKGCNPPYNTMFCPYDWVTRGQMAAFLHRALGDVLVPGAAPTFRDIAGSVFAADIEWLGAVGVTRGCNPPANDRYCPEDYVDRGQMAAFLVRAMGYEAGGGLDHFIDDDGSIFEADINRLATAGVTLGCNPPINDIFCHVDPVERGQMAAFLRRALGG